MFLTLTALNDGNPEIVNLREIRRAWISRNEVAQRFGNEVESALVLVIEFVGATSMVRYVPVDRNERPDPKETDAATALHNFNVALLGAVR
ncbi:hypothetical protein ITJ43_14935 [Microbacterium sp. VKM Ac-2870]|uniref:hypothetical protein n=1 Tax=Microbacterium sp. VKM Ac-2870 TaxID=2783825 RepID=UPI00188B2B9D|nr:hypothetical protein [Microbacterium sp. VKM Ac-2870]MBF4563426.1 hypothetical protein [Microbacterium sp. VKM Ac-2870]